MEKIIPLLDIPCPPGEKRVMGFQPLSLLSLGSYLERFGERVVIVDGRAEGLTINGILKKIERIDPFLIGISSFTPFIAYAYNIISIIKERHPNIKILLGGPHVTATYPDSLDECTHVDFCIYGEGEESLLELVRAIKAKNKSFNKIRGLIYREQDNIIINNPRAQYLDLDTLPPLNYNLIDNFRIRNYDSIFSMGKNVMAMVVSRGCPFKCSFCGAQVIHGHKVRYVPVDKVLDEIENKISRYAIGYVSIKDSTFTVDKSWVINFCKKLMERRINITWGCNARIDCIDEDLLDVMVMPRIGEYWIWH